MKLSTMMDLVDRLGFLKAQAAETQREIDMLTEQFKRAGMSACEGKLFRATLSVSERMSIDADEVKRLLGAKTPMKSALVESVRVTARCTKSGSTSI